MVGTEAIDDVVAFFCAFEGMEEGFRARVLAVEELLAAPDTAFVLVTSPGRDALEEAEFFAHQLERGGQLIDALIVNRVHPLFGNEAPSGLRAAAAELRNTHSGAAADRVATRLAVRYENLADFREVADLERVHLRGVHERIGSTSISYVPYLSRDVYDFAVLHEIGGLLFDATPPSPPRLRT